MRILRLKDVVDRIGLSKPTIYRMIKKDEFPKPLQLTKRSIGWNESDIDNWIESRLVINN